MAKSKVRKKKTNTSKKVIKEIKPYIPMSKLLSVQRRITIDSNVISEGGDCVIEKPADSLDMVVKVINEGIGLEELERYIYFIYKKGNIIINASLFVKVRSAIVFLANFKIPIGEGESTFEPSSLGIKNLKYMMSEFSGSIKKEVAEALKSYEANKRIDKIINDGFDESVTPKIIINTEEMTKYTNDTNKAKEFITRPESDYFPFEKCYVVFENRKEISVLIIRSGYRFEFVFYSEEKDRKPVYATYMEVNADCYSYGFGAIGDEDDEDFSKEDLSKLMEGIVGFIIDRFNQRKKEYITIKKKEIKTKPKSRYADLTLSSEVARLEEVEEKIAMQKDTIRYEKPSADFIATREYHDNSTGKKGHFRTYKSGKKVWIEGKKSKDENIKVKIYKI